MNFVYSTLGAAVWSSAAFAATGTRNRSPPLEKQDLRQAI
jgi:hypothetical protein